VLHFPCRFAKPGRQSYQFNRISLNPSRLGKPGESPALSRNGEE
jgi:hypothetical protein